MGVFRTHCMKTTWAPDRGYDRSCLSDFFGGGVAPPPVCWCSPDGYQLAHRYAPETGFLFLHTQRI